VIGVRQMMHGSLKNDVLGDDDEHVARASASESERCDHRAIQPPSTTSTWPFM
jgi:hypothetical protein